MENDLKHIFLDCKLSHIDIEEKCNNVPEEFKMPFMKIKEEHEKEINDFYHKLHESPELEKKYYDEEKFKSPFRSLRGILANQYHIPAPSNAWLKCYEIIGYYDLIPKNARTFTYFDNASFPGSFVLATNHYVHTRTNIRVFKWMASSYVDQIENITLGDDYGLYQKYPEKYPITEKNNGDVSDPDNCKYIAEQVIDKIGHLDLYTSDLGMSPGDVINNKLDADFDRIDTHQMPNIGQIYCALLMLKPGGHMFIKCYHLIQSLNISMVALLCNFFEDVRIMKPKTSRIKNNEIYVLGMNFIGLPEYWDKCIYDRMKEARANKEAEEIPLINWKNIPKEFKTDFNAAMEEVLMRRINAHRIKAEMIFNEDHELNDNELHKKWIHEEIKEWLKENPVLRINPEKNIMNPTVRRYKRGRETTGGVCRFDIDNIQEDNDRY